MNINEAFPSKWLRAADLKGHEVNVQIERCSVEDLGGNGSEDEMKPVIWFVNKQKGLGLNKTNAHTIANMYGPETDNWQGRWVTLFPTETDYAGKRVECIRVKMRPPQMGNNQMPAANSSQPAPQPEPPAEPQQPRYEPIDTSEIPF